jgi:predicted nucleic-acid-binding protein
MSEGVVRSVDTNVLVRLVTRDDARQVAAAEDFVARGAWVPHVVLIEAMWVLSSVYDRTPAQIATTVEMLLNHEHLTIQDADVVTAAVTTFRQRPTLGFLDCLVLEISRKAGHLPLGTFDRILAKIDGAERL